MKRYPKMAKMQRACDAWNAKNPIGSNVVLRQDSGDEMPTKTRSAAFMCSAGYPVIFVEGVAGYYLLDRVTRMPVVPALEGERHSQTS